MAVQSLSLPSRRPGHCRIHRRRRLGRGRHRSGGTPAAGDRSLRTESEQHHLAAQLATQILQAHEQGRFGTLGPEDATEKFRRAFTAEVQRHSHQNIRKLFGAFEGLDFVETRSIENQPHLLVHRFRGRYGAASQAPEVRVVLDRDGKLAGLWIKPWQEQML